MTHYVNWLSSHKPNPVCAVCSYYPLEGIQPGFQTWDKCPSCNRTCIRQFIPIHYKEPGLEEYTIPGQVPPTIQLQIDLSIIPYLKGEKLVDSYKRLLAYPLPTQLRDDFDVKKWELFIKWKIQELS